MSKATQQMIARLNEAEAALEALDQLCGEDPSGEILTGAARIVYQDLTRAMKGAADVWNHNLPEGGEKIFRCEQFGLEKQCDGWSTSRRCDTCTELAYDREHRY